MPTLRHPPLRTHKQQPRLLHPPPRRRIRRTTRRPTIHPYFSRLIRTRRLRSHRTRPAPKMYLRHKARHLRSSNSNRRRSSLITDQCRRLSSIRCRRSRTRRSRLPIRANRRKATRRKTIRSRATGRRSRTRRCRFPDSRTFRTRKCSWLHLPSLQFQCTVRNIGFHFICHLFCKKVCGLASDDRFFADSLYVYVSGFLRISMYSHSSLFLFIRLYRL